MKKELIISCDDEASKIALIEDGRLFELHVEEQSNNYVVGDLFVGKVKKLAPNLNAAFVNIGHDKDAFLHYQDLGPEFRTYQNLLKGILTKKIQTPSLKAFPIEEEIDKNGSIDKVLSVGDEVLLQITKEPISTKGPRVSTQISLTGRYLVLIPFDQKISVSKKIKENQEKTRLKTLIESIKPEGFGVIIRTVAEGKKVAELHNDMNYLVEKWNNCFKNIQKSNKPCKVLSEEDRASAILRDNFNQDFVNIICDDEQMVQEMRNYLEIISPESKKIVQYYDSHIPLLEYYNVEKQLKQSFGKHVNIPSSKGAYLVIEHTEALHVIDVNSGNNMSSQPNKNHALTVNKVAATEIARQLRLRDMGGIIVVDFIDMPNTEHRKELYDHLKEEMKRDKARHKILPPSKFGLIQITRQRVRPEKVIDTREENPNEIGEISAPIVVVEQMEEAIRNHLTHEKSKLYLHVHPFVEAYLTKGLFTSVRMKWFLKYRKWVTIIARDSFKYLEYRLYNEDKKELMNYSY